KRSLSANPIPLAAPVTTATRPAATTSVRCCMLRSVASAGAAASLRSVSMPDLKAALVDVGGTLWPETNWPPWEILRAKRKECLLAAGVEALRVDDLLAELGARTLHADDLEYFDVWAMIDGACAAARVEGVSAEAIRHAVLLPAEGTLEPLPGARALLECVYDLGLSCVIASNGIYRTSTDYWADFRAHDLVELINAVISSVDT